MSIEEKAKAYDEALEKAKEHINSKGIGDTVNLCKHLFPELRESEDENLKNKSGYYKAGKFWKASTLWNAVKGKSPQRVPNRYILQECTWNISSLQHFADEVKNVQEVDLNYPIILDMNGNILDGAHRVVKAYLEGKDIDIVYLGDDEWPEPDYDEEKAVKESEDERIRKALVWHLKAGEDFVSNGVTKAECIAYLEKQKYDRMKPIYDARESFESALEKAWNDYHNGYENVDKLEDDYVECAHAKGFREGYLFGIKKQKENPKNAISIPPDCVSSAKCEDRNSKYGVFPEDVIVVARACEKLEMHGYPELAHALKNVNLYTKPVDYDHEMWKNCEANFEGGKKEVIDHPEKYGLQKEQKPAEWDEFDKDCLKRAVWYIENPAPSVVKDTNLVLWLKSIPERFNLPPKQEWSEEDEILRVRTINRLETLNFHGISGKEIRESIDWLKSLRPSWKPSEEQMEALRRVVNKLAKTDVADSVRLSIMYDNLKKL